MTIHRHIQPNGDGTGFYVTTMGGGTKFFHPVVEVDCPECGGRGEREYDIDIWQTKMLPCDECHGWGKVWVEVEEDEE